MVVRPLIFVCAEQPKATEQCLKPPDLFLAVQCFEIWIANGFHANPRSSYASWWLVVWFESVSMLSIFVCVVGGKLRLLGVHETHQTHRRDWCCVVTPPGNALTQCEPLFFSSFQTSTHQIAWWLFASLSVSHSAPKCSNKWKQSVFHCSHDTG